MLYPKEYKNDYDVIEVHHAYLVGDLEDDHGKVEWHDVDFRYFHDVYNDVFGDTIYVTISGREEIEDHYFIATKDSVFIDRSIVIDPFIGRHLPGFKFVPKHNNRILYVNCKGIREIKFEIPKYYNHVYVNFYENDAERKTNNRYRLRMEYTNKPIMFE